MFYLRHVYQRACIHFNRALRIFPWGTPMIMRFWAISKCWPQSLGSPEGGSCLNLGRTDFAQSMESCIAGRLQLYPSEQIGSTTLLRIPGVRGVIDFKTGNSLVDALLAAPLLASQSLPFFATLRQRCFPNHSKTSYLNAVIITGRLCKYPFTTF